MPDVKDQLFDKRCTGCNALLFKIKLRDGKVEIKCKCGVTNTIYAKPKMAVGNRNATQQRATG